MTRWIRMVSVIVLSVGLTWTQQTSASENIPEKVARLAAAASPSDPNGSATASFLGQLCKEDPLAFSWLAHLLPSGPEEAKNLPPLETLFRQEITTALQEITRRGGKATEFEQRLASLAKGDVAGGGRLFTETALARRQLRLAHLRTKTPRVVFVKRHVIRPSFIAYTEALSDARHERNFTAGTSLCLLDLSGEQPVVRELVSDPYGMMRDPDISFAGDTVLFAWKKSGRNDDYHLHELNLASGAIRQLTFDLGTADYEGVYLPDDSIVFASSRVEQSVPCWYTEVSNLYKINHNGSFLRRLAIDQVHAWHPQPTDDGRIIYSRWDYNDRGQNYPQALFQMNLDGTGQRALYGASSWFPTSLLHARQIPGTQKFLAVASGHHTWQQGKVVEIDPSVGRDEGEGMSFVAPRRIHPYERVDRAMQKGTVFAYPYPVGQDEFLASWAGPDRVSPPRGSHKQFDLYWFHYDGGRELLAADTILSCMSAIPVLPRNKGHVRPDAVDYTQQNGAIYLEDVYSGRGLQGIARGTAKRLRVVEIRYRAASIGATFNHGPDGGSLTGTPIALAQGTWDAKAIVGETPIQADGSVYVSVPALKSLYFQVLDAQGDVIKTMRSWNTIMPGEVTACNGCHDMGNTSPRPAKTMSLALQAGKAQLEPFVTGWQGFSFPKFIQPILDTHCVKCHNGTNPKRMDLRGENEPDPNACRNWNRAYVQLTAATRGKRADFYWSGNPDGPWVKWINKMSQVTPLPPYSAGAAVSPLMALLRKGHEGVKLKDSEFHLLSAWIDLLVPFAGDYYENNTWSAAQKDTYRYYEDKRRINKLTEAEEIRRHVAGLTAANWFGPNVPPLEVSFARAGKVLKEQKFISPEAARGAEFILPEILRPGDTLRVSGARSLRVKLGSLPEGEIFAPEANWTWTVPSAPQTILPPVLFTEKGLRLTVRPLRDAERSAYRNLACNVFADPGKTATTYPHATASSTYHDEARFAARCAIDGFENNRGHGNYPSQSWGPEKADQPCFAVDFGRPVRLDRIDFILRADFPHDETWSGAGIVVDGKSVGHITFRKSDEVQSLTFGPVEGRKIEILNLRWSRPGWCALTELRVWGLDADRTPKAIIEDHAKRGKLATAPLQ